MRTTLVLLGLVVLTGCPEKAAVIADPTGGWFLLTEAGDPRDVFEKFGNSARDLCGRHRYEMTPLELYEQKWARVHLKCTADRASRDDE